jgi:hypothetical protein
MEKSEVIKATLDNFGKALDSRFFERLVDSFLVFQDNHDPEQVDFFGYLAGGLRLVYDANIVQKALRYEIKEGVPSDIINPARSKFIVPIAPLELDLEIAEHASEIAIGTNSTAEKVLKHYLREIRPHICLMPVTDIFALADYRRRISDKDDAPYATVCFEHQALGVVTNDSDLSELGDIKIFSAKDVCEINLIHRKQYAVLVATTINVQLVFGMFMALIFLAKKAWKSIFITGGVAVLAVVLLRQLKNDLYLRLKESFLENMDVAKEAAVEISIAVQPFIIEYFDEFIRRETELKENIRSLSPHARGFSEALKPSEGPSYRILFEMYSLAYKTESIGERQFSKILNELGYSAKGIRKILKDSNFVRLENGKYKLRS